MDVFVVHQTDIDVLISLVVCEDTLTDTIAPEELPEIKIDVKWLSISHTE